MYPPDFSQLRRRNIYQNMLQDVGSPMLDSANTSIPPQATTNQPPINPAITQPTNAMDTYNPQHSASDRLNSLLGQMPTREPASNLRKVGNLLVSAVNGPEQASRLFDAPYQQKMQDWETQIRPAEYSANLERQSNIQELGERKQGETERKNQVDQDIRQGRANTYAYKAMHPDHKFIQGKDGVLRAVDPRTNQVTDLGRTGMSDIELDELNFKQAKELEGVRQTGRENLEGQRQTGRMAVVEKQGENAINVKKTPNPDAKTTTTKNMQPAQVKTQRYNQAQELAKRNPQLGKFIKFSGANDFNIIGAGTWGGPTQEQYNQIVNHIYGEPEPLQPGNMNSFFQSPNTGIPSGRIKVKGPDGKMFTVPKEQLEEAKKQGYTEVK